MEIISTPPLSVSENMEKSWLLLNSLKEQPRCILHFYEWRTKAATFGYFTDPGKFLNLVAVEKEGIDLARRPTGGGILFHLTDLAFAFYLPANHPRFSLNTLDNYRSVNGALLDALHPWRGALELLKDETIPQDLPSSHFCMAKPTRYDVVINGLKVAGGAQRRIQGGILHQGSIHLRALPKTLLDQILLPGTCVAEAMERYSAPDLEIDRAALKKAIVNGFKRMFTKL